MSKFILPIAELKPALVGLGKIISKSSTLPVLRMVRVDRTHEGWITITGTDLDAFVTVRLEAPTSGDPTSVLVPFDELAKTTKSCSAGEFIEIEQSTENTVLMRHPVGQQFAEKAVDSLPVGEYPPIPKIEGTPMTIDAHLRTAMLEAMDCASEDETRYVLRGAYIDVSDKKCNAVVGTDGKHLYTSNSFSLPLGESIIIPTNKFLGWKEFNNDGEWQLQADPENKEAYFQISSRRWQFIHKPLDGVYPNWRQVIPKESNTKVEMSEEAGTMIQNLIPRLPLDPRDISKTLGLKAERGKFILLSRNTREDQWTEVEVAGVRITGNPVTIYLNRDFMLKALKFGFNELQIQDALSAMRFVRGGKQMVVMPVNVESTSTSEVPVKPSEAEPATEHQPVSPQEETPAPQQEPKSDSKPEPITQATPKERNTMQTPPINGATPGDKPALEIAITQVEVVRGDFRNAIAGLNKLAESLKAVQREQKSSGKEIESFRQTLRSLQSVRI